MVVTPALAVERERAFGAVAQPELVAGLQLVQTGSELAVRDELEEELELPLRRRGADRVGALDHLAARGVRHSDRHVLARLELDALLGRDANRPQILRVILAKDHLAALVF